MLFLDFGKNLTKRIFYVASWDIKNLNQSFVEEIKTLLEKFNSIIILKKSGIELYAKRVCNPTLLLNPEIYKNLYKAKA